MDQKRIKIFVMDVDGCLTDGNIYLGATGELFKQFNTKDGYGIKRILKENGIIPVIITGRGSDILVKRCQELDISDLIQNSRDKLFDLTNIMNKYNVDFDEVACIGDDIPDLEMIKKCKISGCPYDAVEEVKENVDYISPILGGHGAVRDFIDWIVDNT